MVELLLPLSIGKLFSNKKKIQVIIGDRTRLRLYGGDCVL